MSILITLVFLTLISFWVLGYTYLDSQTMIQVEQRKLHRMQQDIERKMQGLKQEQQQYQSSIKKLEKEISQLQASLQSQNE
ncbi:MAG: hypothetical protein ACLFRL_07300 [Desulfohalobiaceae bacterium]